MDSQKRSLYDEIIPFDKISANLPIINSLAKSFRELKKNRPASADDIIKLMKVPKDDQEKLKTIIPQDLKSNFDDKSLLLNLSHWIRNVFLKRPGFVYDRLWLSTMLGIKANSFNKVEKLFDSAKYSGIFADESNEYWWKSKSLAILSQQVDAHGLPWEKGTKLPKISKNDFSTCHVTKAFYPETVAFVDQTKDSKRAPMKLSETLPHPSYEDLLFFEEIRLMKPAR